MPKKPAIQRENAAHTVGKRGQEHIAAAQRVERALFLLMPLDRDHPEGPRCGFSYTVTRDKLMAEFTVSDTTAERDLANAQGIIRDRVAATDFASLARLELQYLASRATERGEVGDWAVAKGAWEKLGRWAGLEGAGESGVLGKLTDAALNAAIENAVKERMLAMTDEQIAELQQQRAAKMEAK